MKYIDSEKLIAEIVKKKNQLVSLMSKTYYAANYKEWEAELKGYNKILSIIASLQQEQQDNEDIDKVAQELYEHLYELKRHNNLPTNLYDKQEIIALWKAGIEYAYNHPKQEQPIEGKQVIIITETDGDANIHWDCRSLDDVMALLKSAESFIDEKQIEKISGPGSGPDYATTEGRYSYLFKRHQEQPEVDLEKEYKRFINCDSGRSMYDCARHFAKWGATHLKR